MRIAIVHSFYSESTPSGENELVRAQHAALERAGHDVALFGLSTDDLAEEPLLRTRASVRTATGYGRTRLQAISNFRPDVVHVHNLFPNFGWRWLRKLHAPYVVTVHNYRYVCAAGTLYRNGRTCMECAHSKVPGLVHRCYRGKLRATIPLVAGQSTGVSSITDGASKVILLSGAQLQALSAMGMRVSDVDIIPNFLPSELDLGAGAGGDAWLGVGRFSKEKGFPQLLEVWPKSVPLTLVGSGDGERRMRQVVDERGLEVKFVGKLPRSNVVELMRGSRGLVFPSRWIEPFGQIYVEALAAGTPVLAVPPGAASGLVEQDGAGRSVAAITEDAVMRAHSDFRSLRAQTRAAFESRYAERVHVESLLRTYHQVLRVGNDE